MYQTKPVRTNRRGAETLIDLRQPFIASAMTGQFGRDTLGYLPAPWRGRFLAAPADVFVVYSYTTPIAWLVGDTVTIPPVKYSATTSRHQSIVRSATRDLRDVTSD